jgi:putative PIN family toxin of toxin-antitoxin system
MRVVLDTNILVAASRSRRGASFRIMELIPDSRFEICLSLPLYLEYLDVLTRPEHRQTGLSEQQIYGAVRYLAAQSHLQEIYFHWHPFLPDASDDMLLDLAVAARAKIIVTFNLKHFRGSQRFGVRAITPRDFLAEIGEI